VTIGGAKAETIAAAKALSIGAAYQVSVGGAMNTSVGLIQAEEVGLSKNVLVSKKLGPIYIASRGVVTVQPPPRHSGWDAGIQVPWMAKAVGG